MKLPGIIQFRKCTLTDEQLAVQVAEGLQKMYTPPVTVPTRNIPARPNEDFDLLVGELVFRFNSRIPNSYLLAFDEECRQEVTVEATKYGPDNRPTVWAVRRGSSCIRKSDGAFIYEPRPSSCENNFFVECRFASFEEAERIYLSFHFR